MSIISNESSGSTQEMTLIGFEKCGTNYHSATPVETEGSDEIYNLISLLALVQHLKVDLLPITWQPFLDSIGLGGTAVIRQSLISLQMSLAFKRVKDSDLVILHEGVIFKRIIAEVSVLGHSMIKGHPNIVSLLGLSWHVVRDQSTWKIWPVLVFEKTPFGNLKEFMQSEHAKVLRFEDKVHLCACIARATRDMHASSIIHGDLKPENVLVMKDSGNQYHAQVTDFGYSTVLGKSSRINMPYSPGWTAPEYPRRGGYLFSQAVQMDIFSFGLICLWLLFFPLQKEVPEEVRDALPGVLEDLLQESQENSSTLAKVLEISLQPDFATRATDFVEICQLLGPSSFSGTLPQNDISNEISCYPRFSIANSAAQLYRLDYRIRTAIFNELVLNLDQGTISLELREELESQIALCFTLGFGIDANPAQAQFHVSNIQKEDTIEEAIKLIRKSNYHWHSPITSLTQDNTITPIDFNYYREQGVLESAEATYRREITTLSNIFGLDHIILISLRSELSSILRDQAHWDEAEQLDVDALERSRRVEGNGSSITLKSLGDLAATYWEKGEWGKAEPLFLERIKTSEKVLGSTHTTTMIAKHNLASTFRAQGKWAQAEELEEGLYDTSLDKFGLKHPHTLKAMSNLGTSYRKQGKYEQAQYLEAKVLEVRKEILGPKHPDTLLAISHLALTHSEQGQWEKAIELEGEAQKLNAEVLGSDHPITLTSMGNLGRFYMNAERWDEARLITSKTIEAKIRVMGPDHHSLLTSMSNLASIYCREHRLQEGEEMHRRILAARIRTLPSEHPDILESLHNIAEVLLRSGQVQEAYDILDDLYQKELKVLGQRHPTTLASLEHLWEARYLLDK